MDGGARRLQFMESQRVGHNWVTNTHNNVYIYIKLNCCAVHLKLTWYCKSTTHQLKKNFSFFKVGMAMFSRIPRRGSSREESRRWLSWDTCHCARPVCSPALRTHTDCSGAAYMSAARRELPPLLALGADSQPQASDVLQLDRWALGGPGTSHCRCHCLFVASFVLL